MLFSTENKNIIIDLHRLWKHHFQDMNSSKFIIATQQASTSAILKVVIMLPKINNTQLFVFQSVCFASIHFREGYLHAKCHPKSEKAGFFRFAISILKHPHKIKYTPDPQSWTYVQLKHYFF